MSRPLIKNSDYDDDTNTNTKDINNNEEPKTA